MRQHLIAALVVGLLAVDAAPAWARGTEAKAQKYLTRARKADQALRHNPERLRFRHNIELLIRRWRIAKRLSKGHGALRVEAARGEAAAWSLLAHWSGRAEDKAEAKRLAELLRDQVDDPDAPLAADDERSVLAGDAESLDPKPSAAAPVRAPTPAPGLLAIRKVVVDAGHGGEDHGAVGPQGMREADVNLAIARRLGRTLEQRLGVEVVYTRTEDSFVSLSDRTRFANAHQADLFISVHANAHTKRRVHGIETYYLNTTSDRYALRLARRENAASKAGAPEDHVDAHVEPKVGMDPADHGELPPGTLGQDLRLVLADLAMRSATADSRKLAGLVQQAMVDGARSHHDDVKDLGVKHALFFVLLGARMPAVLVETGFMSHHVESARLASPTYRAAIADAIAAGVERFVAQREQAALRIANRAEPGVSAALASAAP